MALKQNDDHKPHTIQRNTQKIPGFFVRHKSPETTLKKNIRRKKTRTITVRDLLATDVNLLGGPQKNPSDLPVIAVEVEVNCWSVGTVVGFPKVPKKSYLQKLLANLEVYRSMKWWHLKKWGALAGWILEGRNLLAVKATYHGDTFGEKNKTWRKLRGTMQQKTYIYS